VGQGEADADTKPFAEKMVQDHQKTSNELKALVDGGKVKAKLPTALDAEHQKLLDDLKAKNGKDFDQSYDQAQLKGHRDAVALFEAYDGGKTQVAPRSNWGRPPDEEPANGQVLRGGRKGHVARRPSAPAPIPDRGRSISVISQTVVVPTATWSVGSTSSCRRQIVRLILTG